jgi:hypothetical protein
MFYKFKVKYNQGYMKIKKIFRTCNQERSEAKKI